MKRGLIKTLLCLCVVGILVSCGRQENKEMLSTEETTKEEVNDGKDNQSIVSGVVLSASDAVLTGQGINKDSEVVDTAFISDLGAIVNVGTDTTITYTVPKDVEGDYDVYLNIGKSPYSVGCTPVSIIINDKEYVTPHNILSSAQDFSDLFSMGKFKMVESISLKAGDQIIVHGKPGYEMEFGGKAVSSMPAIGDMFLEPEGAAVAVGYDATVKPNETPDLSDPISGKTIAWLGSSVTFGAKSGGYSMADAIEDNHVATKSLKYAISGTTLVNESDASYVARLKEIDPDSKIDLLIVQLSTNDATQGKTLGSLSNSKNIEDFDTTTIVGSIEYIIAYAKQTWNCPVVFYTGTYFESTEYASMVDSLIQVQGKWDIGVIDLWNNESMKEIYNTEKYKEYMGDEIHPNREGYVSWWTPVFEEYLTEFFK